MSEALKTHGKTRSGSWAKVRQEHLAKHPTCAACGGKEALEVHHRRPFHLHPDLELDQGNLITLCEKPGHGCHFVVGHLLDWHSFNISVIVDAAHYLLKVKTRPGRAA